MAGIEGSIFDEYDVAAGLLTGTLDLAVGYASVSATSIVSVRASTYTEPAAASNLEVVSSSAQDASAGTGTRTLKVTYYRSDGSGPFTATITMNGTSAVAIGDASAQFVEKLESLTVGSNGTNVGTITIRLNGGGATVGTIVAGDGRTMWAHHYVALGKTCFVRQIHPGMVSVSANFFLRKIAMLTTNAFEEQITPSLRSITAQPTVGVDFGRCLWVPGPARLTLYVRPDASTSGTAHGGFSFLEL